MTIICYKSGIMCSDSRITSEGTIVGNTKKIFKSPDGWIAGGAGGATITQRVREFMSEPINDISFRLSMSNPCRGGDQIILAAPDGKMFSITENGFYEVEADYQVEGSAYKVAMGAMEFGASARQAVEVAIKLEPGMCGGPIQELKL